ncbi:hypothetical protein [Vitiosangium sp. GDMCC 1.1324]|uniref:hypothetical protein n=1 Tax=Vitiosangium sp. (strain GDMCC 1.1324) TaxID=2138576 RepID=UPI000D3A8546|nr:hypothetical protein [Vitiosangium sp. GDMCC 1.1324]PTL82010.1 hypothetical protein DAT35_19550 [Vitiosangium sp. GDMCC 1.1324]
MKKLVSIAALVLLAACQDWPEPVIRSVSPSEMRASEATVLDLDAELPLPTVVDYSKGTLEVDTRVSVSIGTLEVPTLAVSPEGVISTRVPSILTPGRYDVKVTLGDGRTAVRPGGLTVVEGEWPEGYSIDPIGPQRRLEPFTVTVRATGANAAAFRGNVRLETGAGGTIGPRVSEPFVDGVLTQQVVVDSVQSNVAIRVTDLAGHTGTSNTFTLQ